MRSSSVVLVVLLVLGALLAQAPAANAGGVDLLGGISWPLWSEREVEVRAGLSQHLKLSDVPAAGSRVRAVPAIDPPVVPTDTRYGLFDKVRYLRVDLLVLGVDPAQVRQRQIVLDGGEMEKDGYNVVVDLQAIDPDEHILVASVVQDASRVENELNLIIVKIKTARHVDKTDRVVQRFTLVDAANWIEWFVPRAFGLGTDPHSLTEDQKNLVRAAFIEDQLRDSLQFVEPLPRYSLQADAMLRQLHGQQAPFEAPKAAPQPRVSTDPALVAETTPLVQLEVLRWTGGQWVIALSTQTAVQPGGCYRVKFSSPPGYVTYRWGGTGWSQPVNVRTTYVDITAPLCGASR